MAEADWSAITGGSALDASSVARGVTTAFTKPLDGGSYIYGFRSLDTSSGVAGKYCALANFTPIGGGSNKGGSVRAAIKRYTAKDGFFPFFGLIKGTDPAEDGYFLGLTEGASSYYIALKKGSPASGLDSNESRILRVSSVPYTESGDAAAAWHHLRLDVLVNPSGDVIIDVYRNTLTSPYGVTNPSWQAIAGMSQFVDDSIGILSDETPYLNSFYAMFGHYTAASQGAVSLFDHIEVIRQTSP